MRDMLSLGSHGYVKTVGVFLIAIALIAGMVGCGPTPGQYELIIASTAGGSVTTPGEGVFAYDDGTEVDLVAEPYQYYEFVEWAGDVDNIADVSAAQTTITMKDYYAITAIFELEEGLRSLTISSTPGGLVTAPGEGTFVYDEGTVVDLVAEADEGYQFVSWTGDIYPPSIADARDATTTLIMYHDYSITANFAVPTLVRNWHDLNAVRDNPPGIYILMNSLNSTTPGYEELAGPTADGGKGWQPIGGFAGTFDGGGHNISDLFINRPDESGAALFGGVPQGGAIMNLGVVNATVTGDRSVAALAGYVGDTVTNCYSVSSVNGSSRVGGLIASNHGTVTDCYSISSVNGWDDAINREGAGGLIGFNRGTVNNCYSVSDVNGHRAVGGLIGWNYGTVSNCSAAGSASSSNNDAGGLIGWNYATVSDCHATGTATGWHAGGLVGYNFGGYGYCVVTNSYSTGDVAGIMCCAGGLIGSNRASTVTSCYSTGRVTGDDHVGGLVGRNTESSVSQSYATGRVTGDDYVGGLIGENSLSIVTSCYSTANVTGNDYVGGLVGRNPDGAVLTSFWDTETSGQATSDGGTGKTTAEMQDIATFSGATWDIVAVGNPGIRNLSYIWNIVDAATYPFLSWEP